jgi:hypothetical protein
VGDIDGDDKQEVLIGGVGAMLWCRPWTFEKGIVGHGHFHLVTCEHKGRDKRLFVLENDGKGRFLEHVIDPWLSR